MLIRFDKIYNEVEKAIIQMVKCQINNSSGDGTKLKSPEY
jgi:hypothetical protein